MQIDPTRLTALLTSTEAATLAGVAASTIYTWKDRGILEPAKMRNGRPLYRVLDVARAERATRDRARRNHAAAA